MGASRRTRTRGGIRERTVPSVARISAPEPRGEIVLLQIYHSDQSPAHPPSDWVRSM